MWHGLVLTLLGRVARFIGGAAKVPGLRTERGLTAGGFSAPPLRLADGRLSDAALNAVLEASRALLERPGVRVTLEAAVLRVVGRAAPDRFRPVEAADKSAERIIQLLSEAGISASRIGIDGLPGSGKSTLARALARRLDLPWRSLDKKNMDVPQELAAPGAYEHHRLFRTQDVDAFDAIVFIDVAPEDSKERVLRRATEEAREGVNVDFLDYERLQTIGRAAFDVCDGEIVPINETGLSLKVRPPGGFRSRENLASRLAAAGHDPGTRRKEELLFLLCYGRARGGLLAYVQPGTYNAELLRGVMAGLRAYFDR